MEESKKSMTRHRKLPPPFRYPSTPPEYGAPGSAVLERRDDPQTRVSVDEEGHEGTGGTYLLSCENSDGTNAHVFPISDRESALLRGRALVKAGFTVTLRDGAGLPITLDANERYVRVGRTVLTNVLTKKGTGTSMTQTQGTRAPQRAVLACRFVEEDGTSCALRATTRGYCDKHYQRVRDAAMRAGTWESKAGKRSTVPLPVTTAATPPEGEPQAASPTLPAPIPPTTAGRNHAEGYATAETGYTASWKMVPGQMIRDSVVEFTTQVPLTVAILLEEQAQAHGLDLSTFIRQRFDRLLTFEETDPDQRQRKTS
jgi:hypothetical protein